MTNPDRLYWNRQGAVNCGKHTPMFRSDTWDNEGWRSITPSDAAEAVAMEIPLRCEVCGR